MDLHTFRQRLDNTLPRLVSDELLSNTGLGNEIGFYIFDYPPEYELEMRDHIGFLLEQIPKKRPGIRIAHELDTDREKKATDFFAEKIADPMLPGDIKRIAGVDTDVILFNIDSRADASDGRTAPAPAEKTL